MSSYVCVKSTYRRNSDPHSKEMTDYDVARSPFSGAISEKVSVKSQKKNVAKERRMIEDDIANNPVEVVNGQLSYVCRNSETIPYFLAERFGSQVKRLDLSNNRLTSLSALQIFPVLEEVILDSNGLTESVLSLVIQSSTITTLSLNKNQLSDLNLTMLTLRGKFPNLTYLSLLGNSLCPDQLSGDDADDDDYTRYRLRVVYCIPTLKFLDYARVTETERREAIIKGPYLNVCKPPCEIFSERSKDKLKESSYVEETRYRPLPRDLRDEPTHKAIFDKCRYVYHGKHSEGNRFIRNNDL